MKNLSQLRRPGQAATPRAREPGHLRRAPQAPRPATPPALDPATAGVAVDRLAEVESIR